MRIVDALERMSYTKANYVAAFVSDATMALILIVHGLTNLEGAWLTGLAVFAAGLFKYTFWEYVFHRWLFHGANSPARRGHIRHHREPHELIAQPFFVGAVVAMTFWLIFTRFFAAGLVSIFISALLVGYLYYSSLHHAQHHDFPFRGKYLRNLKALHYVHHSLEHVNYGVTTLFWDHVFGTHYLAVKAKGGPEAKPESEETP